MSSMDKDQLPSVTWTKAEALRLLSRAPLRIDFDDRRKMLTVQIYIDNEWLHLSRTDLNDNVCTFSYDDIEYETEQTRQVYLGKIKYGARRQEYGSFAVVDSVSDG